MNARGERILIFGDSLTQHVGDGPVIWNVDAGSSRQSSAPGDLLASLLAEQGAQVRTNAKVSRSAFNFWTREPAYDLIAADIAWRPTKIVFVLGTNDLGLAEGPDLAAFTQLRDLYKPTGAELWAIGPFASRKPQAQIDQVAKTMKTVFGSRFIDGRKLSALIQPGADGVHYSPTSARALALSMADGLISASPLKSWLPLAVGAAIIIGGSLALGLWKRRQRGLDGTHEVNIVGGRKFVGSTNELIRSGYRQVPCKSGLDRKGLARCWSLGKTLNGATTLTPALIEAAALKVPEDSRFGGRKIFLADVYDQLRADGMKISLGDFQRALLEMRYAGTAKLARADLVAAMPADKVARSEVSTGGASWHFIIPKELAGTTKTRLGKPPANESMTEIAQHWLAELNGPAKREEIEELDEDDLEVVDDGEGPEDDDDDSEEAGSTIPKTEEDLEAEEADRMLEEKALAAAPKLLTAFKTTWTRDLKDKIENLNQLKANTSEMVQDIKAANEKFNRQREALSAKFINENTGDFFRSLRTVGNRLEESAIPSAEDLESVTQTIKEQAARLKNLFSFLNTKLKLPVRSR